MAEPKPIIFFSHSSKDGPQLRRLKDRFLKLVGKTVEVFLSSDGKSIQLGSNWLARVAQALGDAKLMFVFVTPNSVNSRWLYFETGHAFSKGIRVVPVGLYGVNIGKLGPPLNLLQGFNVSEPEALNNIIAVVNEVLGTEHENMFTQEDFDALHHTSASHGGNVGMFGTFQDYIQKVSFTVLVQRPLVEQVNALMKEFDGFVDMSLTPEDQTFLAAGIRTTCLQQNDPAKNYYVEVEVDTAMAHVQMPKIEAGLRKLLSTPDGADCTYTCNAVFNDLVAYEGHKHSLIGRVVRFGVDVNGAMTNAKTGSLWFRRQRLGFSVQGTFGPSQRTEIVADLKLKAYAPTFSETNIGELIDFLFDREVFYIPE